MQVSNTFAQYLKLSLSRAIIIKREMNLNRLHRFSLQFALDENAEKALRTGTVVTQAKGCQTLRSDLQILNSGNHTKL